MRVAISSGCSRAGAAVTSRLKFRRWHATLCRRKSRSISEAWTIAASVRSSYPHHRLRESAEIEHDFECLDEGFVAAFKPSLLEQSQHTRKARLESFASLVQFARRGQAIA